MQEFDLVAQLLELLGTEEGKKIEIARKIWNEHSDKNVLMKIFQSSQSWSGAKEEELYRRLTEMGITSEAEIWSFRTGRPVHEAPLLLSK